MPPKEKNIWDPSSPAAHTRSKEQAGGHVRTGGNGEPETPTTRSKRKLKQEKRKAAKRAKLLETVQQTDPVETVEQENPGKSKLFVRVVRRRREKRQTGQKRKRPHTHHVTTRVLNEKRTCQMTTHLTNLLMATGMMIQRRGGKVPRTPDAIHDSPDDDESSGDDEDSRHSNFLKRPQQNRKESSCHTQEGAADPPSEDGGTSPKAAKPTSSATKNNRPRDLQLNAELEVPTVEKNVAQRITIFVKNNLFRRIKFVTSQASFTKAFQKV